MSGKKQDPELVALARCYRLIVRLPTPEARARVAAWLAEKFLPEKTAADAESGNDLADDYPIRHPAAAAGR